MIYLDYNATAPLRPEALAAMRPWLEDDFGNASSAHQGGRRARAAIEAARRSVAAVVGATASEIVFTGGGTESNNLALAGVAEGRARPHFVAAPIEHSSVVGCLRALEARGGRVTWLPVDRFGRVDARDVGRAIEAETVAVSVGWANNEIGTIQPIGAIAALCRAARVPLHVDAVQALGKVPLTVADVDLCSFSAHKVGGPKGVGALFVRRGLALQPLFHGGSQERGLRPGTENVGGIAGFGAAADAIDTTAFAAVAALRERLWRGLSTGAGVRRNSPAEACLPNTLHASFAGVPGEVIVAALDLEGIAVSAGSACAAGASEPSHVLRALGRDDREAREGVRFSLGLATTAAEIDVTVAAVSRVLERVRGSAGRMLAHG
jgi:cysteine desulfurase